jgi:outer membrane protein
MKKNTKLRLFSIKNIVAIMLLLYTFNSSAQDITYLSWNEAVNQVLEQNPNLASTKTNLEAINKNIAIAKASYLPEINLGGAVSKSKTATFSSNEGGIPASAAIVGASLSQLIYNEQQMANYTIQKYLYASEEEQYRSSRYKTISTTGMTYIGLLFAKDLLDVQKENLQITEKNLQAARNRNEMGSTSLQEVLRWETQLYADKQDVASQKAAVIINMGHLNQLLNIPIETNHLLEKVSVEKNGFIFSNKLIASSISDDKKSLLIRDYLVELGLANSPALASIEQELLAQNRRVDANKRWVIPTFNFNAGTNAVYNYGSSKPGVENSATGFWQMELNMLWPVFNGGANINKVKQSRFQYTALELQKTDIKTSLEQSIRASVAVVMSDYLNIDYANAQSEAAFKNYNLVNEAYLQGESSLLDLLDAQNQKLIADISSRMALYTFMNDLLAVEQAIGFFPFIESQEKEQKIISELEGRLLTFK